MGVRQNFILHHKFDIGDTTSTLLEIEARGRAGIQFGAHPLAHFADLSAQSLGSAFDAQYCAAQGSIALGQLGGSRHHARPRQRLMLPGPGLVALVVGEGFEGADQQAGAAAGPQAGIDFVQIAGPGARGQPIDNALHQFGEKAGIVDLARPGGQLPFAGAIVQEHQIQIGAVIELDAAQLAVGDDGETGIPL